MKTLQEIMNDYHAKWDKFNADNNICEDDEMYACWGWQFDSQYNFITSPELLLACYIYAYGDDAVGYLQEHFIDYPHTQYTDMAKQAINIYNAITQRKEIP